MFIRPPPKNFYSRLDRIILIKANKRNLPLSFRFKYDHPLSFPPLPFWLTDCALPSLIEGMRQWWREYVNYVLCIFDKVT